MIITIIICVTRIKYCATTCTHAPTAEWVIRIENIKQCWFIACLLTLAVSNSVSEHDGKLLQTSSRILLFFFFQYQSWENGLRTSKKKKTDYYTFRFSHYITHNINILYTIYWYIISVSMLQVNMCDLIICFIINNNIIVNLSAASNSRRRLLNTVRVMHLTQ